METPRLNSGAPLPPNHARSATSRENSHVQPQQSHSDIDERIVTLQRAGHRFVRIDRIAKEPFQDAQAYLDEATKQCVNLHFVPDGEVAGPGKPPSFFIWQSTNGEKKGATTWYDPCICEKSLCCQPTDPV